MASLEDSEEPFLTLSQEVASSFLSLYLDGDKAKSDLITRSPAQERAGDKTSLEKDGPPPVAENDVAIQVSLRQGLRQCVRLRQCVCLGRCVCLRQCVPQAVAVCVPRAVCASGSVSFRQCVCEYVCLR